MPKKTRRQKILAQARRIVSKSRDVNTATPGVTKPVDTASSPYSFSGKVSQTAAPSEPSDSNEYRQIRKDILKTLIIAVLAIIGEIVLAARFG